MELIEVARVSELQVEAIAHLVEESLSEGFGFMERLVREYQDGSNRFDRPNEVLLSASAQGKVIGMGGLNRDPYTHDPQVGRLRHLYVEFAWRRRGVGHLLITQLIHEATQHYQFLTLRTDTPTAAAFYQKLGFHTHPVWEHTTHHLQLSGRALVE